MSGREARVRLYEWAAGRLLLSSYKARMRRAAPCDAHELRHIQAAIEAGNSDPCDDGRRCSLDNPAEVARP